MKYIFQRMLSFCLAVAIAIVFSLYLAESEFFWMPLAAIIVMFTPAGVALRLGLQRYFILVFVVILLSVINGLFTNFVLATLYNRLFDISVGAAIGIITNLLVFPRRADVEFRFDLIPIIYAYSNYLSAIIALLFHEENSETQVQHTKITLEVDLVKFTPRWVYEPGFTVSLRPGHRFFLLMLERVGQTLFSMHNIARHSFDPELLEPLRGPIQDYVAQVKKIMAALIVVLNLKKISEGVSDLNQEWESLETTFKKVVPLSLELLDLSKDYIYLTALIEDLKDLRLALLKLIQALR